jgi:hypothetical protein
MKKYSIFIKSLPTLADIERTLLADDIAPLLKKYSAKNFGIAEVEIEIGDTFHDAFVAWNEFKTAIKGRAFFVWYRHDNEGITVASEPELFAEELKVALQNPTHSRLQTVRDVIKSTL